MSGYWDYRASNHSWHMAKDIAAPQGHAVYAIADGVVAESKSGAGYGGVLVIWHKTGDGQKFLAVYGHITRKNLRKGAKVKGGQLIGTINSERHVHFGVHPGDAYPPDRNPFRGHTYIETETYGWVDPIKFLKTHPAYLRYTAPPLPLTTTVSTASTPTVLGVADGVVYWRLPFAEEPDTVFTRVLASGVASQVAEDAGLPTLDTKRYFATVTATAFKLFDRRPVLTATYSSVKPACKHAITISGTLANAGGKPFSGATICLEQAGRPGFVTLARAISGPQGTYSLNFTPSRSCNLRLTFTPPSTYVATTTAETTVAPRPGLHTPDSFKQAKTAPVVLVSGKLDARHSVGAHTVSLRFQQLTASGWTDFLTTSAVNANAAKNTTRYSRQVTLAVGSWRVSASCAADSLHAGQVSGWATFTVK